MTDSAAKVNDTVRLLRYPEDHINGYARVVAVHNDHILVSNANMPFMGTLHGARFENHEFRPVRPAAEEEGTY